MILMYVMTLMTVETTAMNMDVVRIKYIQFGQHLIGRLHGVRICRGFLLCSLVFHKFL